MILQVIFADKHDKQTSHRVLGRKQELEIHLSINHMLLRAGYPQ